MSFFEIITLFLAGWGALLSTILAVIELLKDKKPPDIRIEIGSFSYTATLVIQNMRNKPMVITSISAKILYKNERIGDPVPLNALFFRNIKDEAMFPYQLEAGSEKRLQLMDSLIEHIENENFLICVFDANGRAYKRYKIYFINEKFGGFGEIR